MARTQRKWEDGGYALSATISTRAARIWKDTMLPFGDFLESLLGPDKSNQVTSTSVRLDHLENQLNDLDRRYETERDTLQLQIKALQERRDQEVVTASDEEADILAAAKAHAKGGSTTPTEEVEA